MMTYAMDYRDGVALVTAAGRLSSAVADAFQDWLMDSLNQPPTALVLDFAQVTFITSSGLRALILAAKRGHKDGYHVHICGLCPPVHEVFEVSGLLKIFLIHADLDQAMAAVAP